MKRYYQAMLQNDIPPGQSENVNYVSEASVQNCQQIREEVDVDKLPIDPAKRKSIYDSHVNDREKIRRFYLQKGPCQPICCRVSLTHLYFSFLSPFFRLKFR
ncbi:hypothetical protein POM88_048458 [Heracleum sosnowskyi]|uniref:Uncharacterized protein n=1 Tax=Heracleum sosnowskyi TaxID=360622 RepID=A0AAD8M0M8_9APIA|nr:hypothetical protein POM88_048458 [Heracleum sosnowskyi]